MRRPGADSKRLADGTAPGPPNPENPVKKSLRFFLAVRANPGTDEVTI